MLGPGTQHAPSGVGSDTKAIGHADSRWWYTRYEYYRRRFQNRMLRRRRKTRGARDEVLRLEQQQSRRSIRKAPGYTSRCGQ